MVVVSRRFYDDADSATHANEFAAGALDLDSSDNLCAGRQD